MVVPRHLIARLMRRLSASPLPYAERCDLEAELNEHLTPTKVMRCALPLVLVVDEDARGDCDTSVP